MEYMFNTAIAFNQDIGNWDVSNVTNMNDMFYDSGISADNYDNILIAWDAARYPGKNLGNASPLRYCAGLQARTNLIAKGWEFSGDTYSNSCLEIDLKGNNVTISNGQTTPSLTNYTDFGSAVLSGNAISRTFTIENSGTGMLNLPGSPKVAINGASIPDFTLTQEPAAAIPGGTSTTFKIMFNPTAAGLRTATVSIANDDPDENPYTFTIKGTVVCNPLITSPGNVDITWNGSVSTDWSTPCNWTPTWVPDISNAKVVIPNTTNKPIINGSIPDIKVLEINSNTTLTVNEAATLNIRGNDGTDKGILVFGTLTNNGTLNIESRTQQAIDAYIYLRNDDSKVINNGTMKINSTDEAIGVGVSNISSFENNSTGIINIKNGIGIEVAYSGDNLNFTNLGTINYDGDKLALSLQGSTNFINEGSININSGTGISVLAPSNITNVNCGKIIMQSGTYSGTGTTTNSGLLQMPNAYDFVNTATFTNNGVLKAKTVSGITNNALVLTNTCSIFTLSRSNSEYELAGIFADAAATVNAGSYDITAGTLTIEPSLPVGKQTLYAKVSRGSCVFVVPFDYNNLLPSGDAIQTLCPGSTTADFVVTNTSTSTYKWYDAPSGGNLIGSSGLLVNGTTYYAAQVLNDCEGIYRLAVQAVLYSKPPTPSITASQAEFCIGESATLSAMNIPYQITGIPDPTPDFTIHWTGGFTGESITVNPSTTQDFRVAVKSADGCLSDSSESVSIVVNQLPLEPVISSDNASLCKGETVVLLGSCETNTFFNWNTPSVNSNGTTSLASSNQRAINTAGTYTSSNRRVVNTAGTYTGYCETAKGCTSGQVSIVITKSPNCGNSQFITISPAEPIICPGETVTLTVSGCAGTYTWSGKSISQSGNTVTFSPSVSTTYFVSCSTGGSETVNVSVMKANKVISSNISTGILQVRALETIESNKKVGNPSITPAPNVIYQSGKSIVLSPGFEVTKKSTFKASIVGCPD
jgi:surface protein